MIVSVATYAIGDIQGCYRSLQNLLEQIDFDPSRDRLWLVGDLVNRGPRSLEVLHWAYAHDAAITTVMGNHDLHLLARAAGLRRPKRTDTLDEILGARDRDKLMEWLRHRPWMHREGNLALVHAGLLPAWTLGEAEGLAREVESALRGAQHLDVLAAMYSQGPLDWDQTLEAPDRWRALAAIFTTLRLCTEDGQPGYDFSGPPSEAPDRLLPWFRVPGRRNRGPTLLFGHWAALGLHFEPGIAALDSACVWGGKLTAVRLPDLAVYQVPNTE